MAESSSDNLSSSANPFSRNGMPPFLVSSKGVGLRSQSSLDRRKEMRDDTTPDDRSCSLHISLSFAKSNSLMNVLSLYSPALIALKSSSKYICLLSLLPAAAAAAADEDDVDSLPSDGASSWSAGA